MFAKHAKVAFDPDSAVMEATVTSNVTGKKIEIKVNKIRKKSYSYIYKPYLRDRTTPRFDFLHSCMVCVF